MKFVDYLCQIACVNMGINFSGSNALMTQHLLNGPEVGTVFKEMGSETVPEGVWAYRFFDSCSFCQLSA